MVWKFWVGLGYVCLLLWTAATTAADSGETAYDRLRALRDDYHRPEAVPFPDDNPYSPAKAALGRALFFDPALSNSGSQSCASCHRPDLSWADGRGRALGDSGGVMVLRSPTLLNVAWTPRLGWDGKFRDLEAVAFAAITGPANMNLPEAEALGRLSTRPGYTSAFAEVFGDGAITRRRVELSLATYERTIVSGDAPFDRWIAGDERAIDDAAQRGFALFNGRARCSACHSGWAFTDGSFHDIGTARGDDAGRGRMFPSSLKLRYAFKTPTLRDVAVRAPYMHDGSVPTLEAVIELYNNGGIERPSRSELIRRLELTDGEKSDLIAFLRTLTALHDSTPAPGAP